MSKNIVFSILGTKMDVVSKNRGKYEKRWERWRPTLSRPHHAARPHTHPLVCSTATASPRLTKQTPAAPQPCDDAQVSAAGARHGGVPGGHRGVPDQAGLRQGLHHAELLPRLVCMPPQARAAPHRNETCRISSLPLSSLPRFAAPYLSPCRVTSLKTVPNALHARAGAGCSSVSAAPRTR